MPDNQEQIVVKEKSGFIRRVLGPILSPFDKLFSMLPKDKRKLTLLIITLAIPITVIAALIQQELRGRAAGERQLIMGMSNRGGYSSKDVNVQGIKEAIETIRRETGRYPAIYPLWVNFEESPGSGDPRASFPSKEITDYLDARGIAVAIFMQPVGPGIGRNDGRFIFSSNTSSSVPNGQIKFDSSNPSSITRIYVSKTSSGTENPAGLANTWVPGAKASVFGSDSSGNVAYTDSNFFGFTVNSKADSGTFWTLGVTVNRAGSLSGIFSNGRPVFITMADTFAKKYSNQSIANGSFDPFLRQLAQAARSYGKPVLLRYAHEMNAHWFPWTVGQPDPKKSYGRYVYFNQGNTPSNYVAAWRRVYTVIKLEAPNVKLFWVPSRVAPTKLDIYDGFYPGNNYVDYVGFDAYSGLGGNNPKNYISMYDSYKRVMEKVLQLSNNRKPVFIGETGVNSINVPSGFSRADWVRRGYNDAYNAWPKLAGIIYFNFDMRDTENNNWLLSASPEALSAYRDIASRAKFQGKFEEGSTPTPTPVLPTVPPIIVSPTPSLGISAFIESGGSVVMEAENNDKRFNRGNYRWAGAAPDTPLTATSGYVNEGTRKGYTAVRPNDDKVTYFEGGYKKGPEVVYNINFSSTGTYYVYMRSSGPDSKSDSAHYGLDGAYDGTIALYYRGEGGASTNWQWKGNNNDGTKARIRVTTPGIHTFHIYMREDGTQIDRIRLFKNSSWTPSPGPAADGPSESLRGKF
ncbi:MAG: hypothetical protein HYW63_02940 [Candidatus Levybacteria bacterium]|nr:hypothetical protein [Candidatus Levybacteria bacterium]